MTTFLNLSCFLAQSKCYKIDFVNIILSSKDRFGLSVVLMQNAFRIWRHHLLMLHARETVRSCCRSNCQQAQCLLLITQTMVGFAFPSFSTLLQSISFGSLSRLLPSVLWHCWLGVRKSIRLVKNWVLGYWCVYLSGVCCKWFSYGPADATATLSSLATVKSRMVYLSGAGLPRLSWKKGR